MQEPTGRPHTEEPDILEDSVVPPQDGFRRVYFGEIGDPLLPPHPEPPEATEDDLTQAALADAGHTYPEAIERGPTAWRMVVLLLVAAGALAFIFWKR